MSKAKDKPMRFEEAVAQLEAIVERIESGEIGLEESIAEYERGMKLVGRCQEVLGAVQTRIAELTADAEGKLRIKAGEGPGDEAGGTGDDEAAQDTAGDSSDDEAQAESDSDDSTTGN